MLAALRAASTFGPAEVRRYDWDQTYTAAEFRRLMLTYSSDAVHGTRAASRSAR